MGAMSLSPSTKSASAKSVSSSKPPSIAESEQSWVSSKPIFKHTESAEIKCRAENAQVMSRLHAEHARRISELLSRSIGKQTPAFGGLWSMQSPAIKAREQEIQ